LITKSLLTSLYQREEWFDKLTMTFVILSGSAELTVEALSKDDKEEGRGLSLCDNKPKRCINRLIFNLSFPQSLSRNPDAVPVKTGNQNAKNLDARLKTSGMTKNLHQESTYSEL
jgi:hypothetical protein